MTQDGILKQKKNKFYFAVESISGTTHKLGQIDRERSDRFTYIEKAGAG